MGASRLISVWGDSIASAGFVRTRILLLFPNLVRPLGLAKLRPTHHTVHKDREVSLHLRGIGNPWVMEVPSSTDRR